MSKMILKNAARYMSPDRKIFVKGAIYDDKEIAKVPKEDQALFAAAPAPVDKPEQVEKTIEPEKVEDPKK